MRILIFDTNRIYARQIGTILTGHIIDATIDYAFHPAVLQRRLKLNTYNILLVDMTACVDNDWISEILQTNSNGATVIIWSAIDEISLKTRYGDKYNTIIQKEKPAKMSSLVESLIKM